jgi:AcrR family transcriptional regulator
MRRFELTDAVLCANRPVSFAGRADPGGLARATTNEIAKAAGFSEAALYKHRRDKTDLFLAVLAERVPSNLGPVLATLPARVGHGTVTDTLDEFARAAVEFHGKSFPLAASLFSEPRLLAAHREALRLRDGRPRHVCNALAAEQSLGRIRADSGPHAAAALLLGACLQHAFLGHFTEHHEPDPADEVALTLTETLFRGLAPGADGHPGPPSTAAGSEDQSECSSR